MRSALEEVQEVVVDVGGTVAHVMVEAATAVGVMVEAESEQEGSKGSHTTKHP